MLIFSLFIFLFYFCFQFKLFSLLILEGIFVLVIYYYYFKFFNLSSWSHMGLMIFCIFMVLDSVLGISSLISSFRNSSFFNSVYISF